MSAARLTPRGRSAPHSPVGRLAPSSRRAISPRHRARRLSQVEMDGMAEMSIRLLDPDFDADEAFPAEMLGLRPGVQDDDDRWT